MTDTRYSASAGRLGVARVVRGSRIFTRTHARLSANGMSRACFCLSCQSCAKTMGQDGGRHGEGRSRPVRHQGCLLESYHNP